LLSLSLGQYCTRVQITVVLRVVSPFGGQPSHPRPSSPIWRSTARSLRNPSLTLVVVPRVFVVTTCAHLCEHPTKSLQTTRSVSSSFLQELSWPQPTGSTLSGTQQTPPWADPSALTCQPTALAIPVLYQHSNTTMKSPRQQQE
jgi:hypothetical protein